MFTKWVNWMDERELKLFLMAQIEEINRYKWIESEKRCHDIGFQQAAKEWIGQYSAHFKDSWLLLAKKRAATKRRVG